MKSERPSLAWFCVTVYIMLMCGGLGVIAKFLGDWIYKLIGG